MFKNEYQGGPYLEIFSPQGRDSTIHWKIGAGVKKIYEKEVKGYIYVLEGTPSTTKMTIPKDNKQTMTLVQRYLVLQVFLTKGQDFSMELGVIDLSNSKRRILLSTAQKETQVTPLHARIPLCIVRRAVWVNLCLDMVSLVGDTWSGQSFRSIEHISVSANCKVRRMFTMKSPPPDTTDDDELYGSECSSAGEVELIPKQVQLAPDIVQLTQVLSMKKIKCAERIKNGRGPDLADQIRPGSMLDLDLNSSANKGNFHIAFGSKVNIPETSRRSSRQGSTTSRSVRSTLSRADGSYGSGSMRDLRDSMGSQDSVMTARSGVKDAAQRPAKPGGSNHVIAGSGYSRQASEPVTNEDHEGVTVNGTGQSHIVTPHPPREPSKDRVRRYHRVKTVTNSAMSNHSQHGHPSNGTDATNTSKDRVSSAGSITEETDSDFASKPSSGTSSATRSSHSNLALRPGEARQGSGDSLTRQSFGPRLGHLNPAAGSRALGPEGDKVQDSVSDVIALLRADEPVMRGRMEEEEEAQSSDSGTESSQPGEYEESDDEGSSDTANKLHLFVSRPMQAPRRNVSPGTSDQEANKRSHVKAARSNVRRSTSEILSSRGARPEDDFHSGMTSSDEDDNHNKPRPGPGSRPHSDTSATGSPKTRGGSGVTDRASLRGRAASVPKTSVSPDFKRPAFNPALYGGDSPHSALPTPRQTPLRRSRKSLREIKPHLEDSVHHSKISDKSYDHTKYQMADVTESFEAQMFASMKRQEEEELEDVSPLPTGPLASFGRQSLRSSLTVRTSQPVCSESPYTTSDDDTSFSTWKAPAPNQMAHNYQDEMKSRLSSDTLTSSNPRDVFSPPIILPADRDLQGTLEGQFEDLNEAGADAHTTGPSASEDEELDLMFDPNLNCYYDPKTLKYYELAT
ncbi:protein CFAP20DC-like [Babylonia areolata]|uniref:protein CFAP20DC-like n=1 Tax=Babylonia areolata TaxID=304850 RepID=UPI003FD12488